MSQEDLKEAMQEHFNGIMSRGLELAERSEKEGGFAEYFAGKLALPETTPHARERIACTAVVMENVKKWYQSLDETQRAIQVGGFIDYLFPMIRASFTNNPIMDLVSVQPMTKKVGLIFYMNYVVGQTKGSYAKGQRIFDAFEGYQGGETYSSEKIDTEQIGTTPGTAAPAVTCQATYLPIRPGSVVITINETTPYVLRDDGNGGLVKVSGDSKTVVAGSTSINYQTGAIIITLSANLETDKAVTMTYEYDSEISGAIPQIDVQLSSVTVQAISRSLRVRYSNDAAFDFRNEFGIDADVTLTQGVAEVIRAEQAREVITDLWNAAGAPVSTFPATVFNPTVMGYSRLEHFKDIVYPIEQASEAIYNDTQRLHGNWIICDTKAATIIKALPNTIFEAAGVDDVTSGVQFIGTLMGRFRVWQDKLMSNLPGASVNGNMLMGFKGNDWIDAGYVWAPYQPLYTTAAITLDDMMTRKAMRMRYAKKLLNSRIYKKIAIT